MTSVLVIDDNKDLLEVAVDFFVSFGLNCLQACDGQEGLQILAVDKSVTAVLCDIEMPTLGGLEFLVQARNQYKELPIFLMTGRPDQSEIKILKLGANALFLKPYIDFERVAARAMQLAIS